MEKELKKILVKTHLEIFGKGPEELWFKIHRNIGTFYILGSLTSVEQFLWSVPGGQETVMNLRKEIFNLIKDKLCGEFERISNIPVENVTITICEKSQIVFGIVLFKDEVA